MDKETKNIVGFLVNLAIPGVGTIIWGDSNKGIIQLILYCVGIFLSFIVIGIPLVAGVWIWALAMGVKRISAKK